MHAKIQKWGNSLAIRIPKPFAVETQLENDSMVDISVVEGQIIVKPLVKADWTLEELLAGINKENIHNEIDTGNATGNEIW
jgi:antitoxin MazE